MGQRWDAKEDKVGWSMWPGAGRFGGSEVLCGDGSERRCCRGGLGMGVVVGRRGSWRRRRVRWCLECGCGCDGPRRRSPVCTRPRVMWEWARGWAALRERARLWAFDIVVCGSATHSRPVQARECKPTCISRDIVVMFMFGALASLTTPTTVSRARAWTRRALAASTTTFRRGWITHWLQCPRHPEIFPGGWRIGLSHDEVRW
jgi:hypothetical protein